MRVGGAERRLRRAVLVADEGQYALGGLYRADRIAGVRRAMAEAGRPETDLTIMDKVGMTIDGGREAGRSAPFRRACPKGRARP